MTNVAMILASHGKMAYETLKSLEMIAGNSIDNIDTVSVIEGMDFNAALNDMRDKFQKLDRRNGTVIITDIYGGTPANIATTIALENEDVFVFSGLNLPVILEIIYQRNCHAHEIASKINEMMSNVMINITEKIKEVHNGNQDDSY